MSSQDGLERALDLLFERAVKMIERPYSNGPVGEMGAPKGTEIIESAEGITAILQAPGLREEDLQLTISEAYVEIRASSFNFKMHLPYDAAPESARAQYRNGVLSLRLDKRF